MRRALVLGVVGVLGALATAPPSIAESPPVEEDYVLHCQACHGAGGAGTPGVVPGLEATGELARLPGGRDYLMRVPGAAQSPLDDARLARLLGWVVAEFGGVALAEPLTADEVGRARRAPLRDPAARRREVVGAAAIAESR